MSAWFCIRTATRQEHKVVEGLREMAALHRLALDVYLPCETRWNRLTRVKSIRLVPMLPGYMFVRIEPKHLWRVDRVESVYQILGWASRHAGKEAEQVDAFVEKLRESQASGKFDRTNRPQHSGKRRHSYKPGQSVEITEGSFMGWIGEITELSGSDRIKVLLSIFGRDTPVEIGADDVVAQDKAPAEAA